MITDNVSLDEFGISLKINEVYSVEKKKIIRKCGFCRVPGHDIRQCEAYKCSGFDCLFKKVQKCCRRADNGFICSCSNCSKFREFNLPNPTVAYYKRKEHIKNINPVVTVTNFTRSEIYIYSDEGSHISLEGTLDPGHNYRLGKGECFEKGEYIAYIVTNRFYGFVSNRPDIEADSILKFTELAYGYFNEVDIKPRIFKEDKWKEAALKSLYLLEQLKRLGVANNPNYEPIIDLVEDIEFPEYGDQDKELAGVTSGLTNVSEVTHLYEDDW
jgi:hypothetical protein